MIRRPPARSIRRVAVTVALAVVAVGCSDDGASESEVSGTRAGGVVRSVDVQPVDTSVLSFVAEVETDEPVVLRATATSEDGHEVRMPATAEPSERHRYPVLGLRAEADYELVLTALDDAGEEVGRGRARLSVGSLPESLPDLEVVQTDPARMAPGLTLFDVGQWDVQGKGRSAGALLALDEEGEVVWYLQSFFTVGDARLTDQGTIIANLPDFFAQEIDVLGRPVQTWELKGRPAPEVAIVERPGGGRYRGIHHEVNPLPNGNILALMRNNTRLSRAERRRYCPGDGRPFRLREDFVVEFTPDGEVVNEWSLRDVIDPAEVPGVELCTDESLRDWTHANGAILDEERNAVIVTARHIDMLLAFRYAEDEDGPSGELLWSLGPGGTLPLEAGELLYHPHAPELQDDGSILVYDNGNFRPGTDPDDPRNPTYSRAVQYEIDDSSPDRRDWSARQVWEHRVDDRDGSPLYADFLGDADRLPNGNVLIGHGGIGQRTPPARGRIIEVIPRERAGGPIVFDVWLPDTWVSYRAERIPSLYAGPDWVTD